MVLISIWGHHLFCYKTCFRVPALYIYSGNVRTLIMLQHLLGTPRTTSAETMHIPSLCCSALLPRVWSLSRWRLHYGERFSAFIVPTPQFTYMSRTVRTFGRLERVQSEWVTSYSTDYYIPTPPITHSTDSTPVMMMICNKECQ